MAAEHASEADDEMLQGFLLLSASLGSRLYRVSCATAGRGCGLSYVLCVCAKEGYGSLKRCELIG